MKVADEELTREFTERQANLFVGFRLELAPH